tara:strand:+ start:493 stop:1164 length:672 start_codon:yes stop_codon:yes gene_type:complete
MIYNYINDIDVTHKFQFILIIISSILISSRINPTGSTFFGLIVGIFIAYYINDKMETNGETFITSMSNLINSDLLRGDKNVYLAKNSELIIFMNKYREYRNYNPVLWYEMIGSIDKFLKIIYEIEIGTQFYNLDYGALLELKTCILNQYQSFIHTIPHTVNSNDKFHLGFSELEGIINKDIDDIHQTVTKKNSKQINIDSVFRYKNHPEPNENLGVDIHYKYV